MTRRRDNETGMSLIELTVVVAIVGVVAVMLYGFLGSIYSDTTRATKDTQTEKAVQLALRPMTENIRGATSILTTYPSTTSCPSSSYPSGYTNCLSFTVLRPVAGQLSCPKSTVTYGLKSDGVLREDRTDYKLVAGACSVVRTYTGRPLLTNVTNGTQPLFRYFDRFGNEMLPGAAGQTTTSFPYVVTVRVSVTVTYKAGAPSLAYTSDLAVRNNR